MDTDRKGKMGTKYGERGAEKCEKRTEIYKIGQKLVMVKITANNVDK